MVIPFGPQRGARDFVGIAQESVQFLDLLTVTWAQHLKQFGQQAALVGKDIFSQRAFLSELMVPVLVKDTSDLQVEATACLTWFLPPGQIFRPQDLCKLVPPRSLASLSPSWSHSQLSDHLGRPVIVDAATRSHQGPLQTLLRPIASCWPLSAPQ